MGTYLVYTILLAIQLVGLESIDGKALEVFQNSAMVYSLDVRTEDSIVRFFDGEDPVLEVERSRIYGHMYTTYTSPADQPQSYSVLDAVLQIPPRPRGSFDITLRGESVPASLVPDDRDGDPESGADEPAGADSAEATTAQPADAAANDRPEAAWEVVVRESAIFLTAAMRDLIVVLR